VVPSSRQARPAALVVEAVGAAGTELRLGRARVNALQRDGVRVLVLDGRPARGVSETELEG
jgi:hypothetical protein